MGCSYPPSSIRRILGEKAAGAAAVRARPGCPGMRGTGRPQPWMLRDGRGARENPSTAAPRMEGAWWFPAPRMEREPQIRENPQTAALGVEGAGENPRLAVSGLQGETRSPNALPRGCKSPGVPSPGASGWSEPRDSRPRCPGGGWMQGAGGSPSPLPRDEGSPGVPIPDPPTPPGAPCTNLSGGAPGPPGARRALGARGRRRGRAPAPV